MMIFFLLLIVAALVGTGWLVIRPNAGSQGNNQEDKSLEILKSRYAKGEIDRTEFEEKRQVLSREDEDPL